MSNPRRAAFTLTELLVVVSIVVLLTALSIPAVLRMGMFTSNRTGDAARDFYQMLRAARLYATTNNVETALVYQTRLVYETANDGGGLAGDSSDMVPIIDSYMICRRLSDTEMDTISDAFLDPGSALSNDEPIFVPIAGANAGFRAMPAGTCILPDIFEVDPADTTLSVKALSPVFVVDPSLDLGAAGESGFMRPFEHPENPVRKLHFQQEDGDSGTSLDNATPVSVVILNPPATNVDMLAFPAHRFAPSGEMLPLQTTQRFRVRIGMLPTAIPQDRFVTYTDEVEFDPGLDPTDTEVVTIQFHSAVLADAPAATETALIFHNPRRRLPEPVGYVPQGFELRQFLENVSVVSVYAATGRVEIEPTVELPDLDTT